MQHRGKKEGLSVMEAVDNLTHMAEIDLTTQTASIPTGQLTEEQVRERLTSLSWQSPEFIVYNRERIKETFEVILNYLKHLYEKDKIHLRDAETQKGIQAIMILINEAAQKIDKCTQMYKGEKEESITEVKEYKELQHFYLSKVYHKFNLPSDMETPWEEDWAAHGDAGPVDPSQKGLKDLETIRNDKEYELFLIRKEDGRPFFNKDLLRHLRLVGEFDEALADMGDEDPFLRIKMLDDRELHLSAQEILHQIAPYVDDFLKDAMKYKEIEFVASITKALMALMLAANSRNMMQNVLGKSSLSYYADFHFYLRKALSSKEYHHYMAHPPEHTEKFFQTLYYLTHALCACFFTRTPKRKEMIAMIRLLIEKGGEGAATETATHSPNALWNTLIDEHENIRALLKHYPNGPVMRAIDVFRSESPLIGFDPLAQDNHPLQLYTLVSDQMHVSCLKMPCPIRQEHIHKAELVEEFYGFLRSVGSERKKQRHLMFNLQDRTSWQEHARCLALEGVQKRAEFKDAFVLITLPKNADFYSQSGPYVNINDAAEFITLFEDQIASAEQCGFFFPLGWKTEEFQAFAHKAMLMIHTLFFGGKSTLVHKNRLDFIEIFYLFMILKAIELYHPDSISFTCKDAIDTGASTAAEVFAFVRMMNDPKSWSQGEKQFLQWMLYSPALTVRERSIDSSRFSRMASAMSVIQAELEAHRNQVISECSKLYQTPFFKGVNVQEASA